MTPFFILHPHFCWDSNQWLNQKSCILQDNQWLCCDTATKRRKKNGRGQFLTLWTFPLEHFKVIVSCFKGDILLHRSSIVRCRGHCFATSTITGVMGCRGNIAVCTQIICHISKARVTWTEESVEPQGQASAFRLFSSQPRCCLWLYSPGLWVKTRLHFISL